MRVLFVAPGIQTPYTEGRKRFILDLLTELSRKKEVLLLTTRLKSERTPVPFPVRSITSAPGGWHLIHILLHLSKTLREFEPDQVCVFPYGTFRHLYGFASVGFILAVDRICRKAGLPCHTILYSMDEHGDPKRLARHISHLVLTSSPDQADGSLRIGLDCRQWPEPRFKESGPPTLLFLAGMWEPHLDRVEHVIQVRGLGQLLRIGGPLSRQGVRLIAAAPLFRSSICKDYLRRHRLNTWPREHLILREEVRVPEIYHEADLFVFPYTREIQHFVPTSVLESMLSGTCVVISDRRFLVPLACRGKTAYLLPLDRPDETIRILLAALNDTNERRKKTTEARRWVLGEWCIEHSANQLLNLLATSPFS